MPESFVRAYINELRGKTKANYPFYILIHSGKIEVEDLQQLSDQDAIKIVDPAGRTYLLPYSSILGFEYNSADQE